MYFDVRNKLTLALTQFNKLKENNLSHFKSKNCDLSALADPTAQQMRSKRLHALMLSRVFTKVHITSRQCELREIIK